MHYNTHILPNGLKIIHLPVESPVSYCGFAINAGARDELASEFGLAHFVEHMLFKGTDKRRSWHILNRMENVGGELNAYTTKEDTFVYSIFMEEHFKRAIELLVDILFNSRFPAHEIEKEKEVILDEINSYKDSPSEIIFDEFENILFSGHALGHNILGEEKTLMKFNTETGTSFLRRYYTPDNMVFFSMGRISFNRIKKWIESIFRNIQLQEHDLKLQRSAPTDYTPSWKQQGMDTYQAHAVIGNRSFSMYDERRIPLFILNNILGGPGMNSRLNLSLRERYGLVYNVESSVTSYSDTGFVSVYFGTDPKHLEKSLQLVRNEFRKLRENRLTTSQLTAAKKQLIGQLGVSGDNKESLFLGLGKSFLHHNRYDSLTEIFEKIEKVTASQLLEIANLIYAPDDLSALIYTNR